MRRGILLAAASLIALSSAATAADMPARLPAKAPAVFAPVFNWTGFYIGAQIGYGWSKVSNLYGIPPVFPDGGNSDGKGILGGAHLGFNWQAGTFVWGVEGDVDATNIKGDDAGIGGDVNQFKFRWMATGRLRGGVLVTPRTLVYLTGGGAYLRGEADALNVAGQPTVGRNHFGWTGGGGIEHAWMANFTTRIEYRYYDFGKEDYNLIAAGYIHQPHPKLHTVRLAGSWKF